MCTLIAIHRQVPGMPLVVAANRDEYLDRPAEGLAIRQTRVGRVMAPLDVRAGGTWLGLNAQGVFAALTNLRAEFPDPRRRSRGEVVLDALGEDTAEAAVDALMGRLGASTGLRDGSGERDEPIDRVRRSPRSGEDEARSLGVRRETYNPFNLFVADETDAWVVVYRDAAEGARSRRLEPGVHVIGNVDAIGAPNAKVERVRREVEGVLELGAGEAKGEKGETGEEKRQDESDRTREVGEGPAQRVQEALLERLAGLCRHHEHASDPLSDTCVHVKGTHGGDTYGTRSSMLLELGRDFREGRLLEADGPPCTTKYQDLSILLHELGHRPGAAGAEAQARTAS